MTEFGSFPPPGSPAPREEQESWFAPPPAPGAYPTSSRSASGGPMPHLAAIHKPGVIPIRPLGLGDIYDGAFKIIRFSPGATVGSALLVAAVAMAIPLVLTGLLSSALDLSLSRIQDAQSGSADLASTLAANGTVLGGALLQTIGVIFVTGMVAATSAAAAVGRKMSLGEAWAATAGKRWRLVGLMGVLLGGTALYIGVTVLIAFLLSTSTSTSAGAVLIVLLVIVAVCGLVFGWGRVYYMAVPPLMLEQVGIWGALGRSWRLTSRQFWRTFGIAVLTMIITQIIGSIMGVPFGIIGGIATAASGDGQAGLMIYLVCTALATVISSAFVTPFTSAVTTLQYLDQRMRKEGYDVELLTGASTR